MRKRDSPRVQTETLQRGIKVYSNPIILGLHAKPEAGAEGGEEDRECYIVTPRDKCRRSAAACHEILAAAVAAAAPCL